MPFTIIRNDITKMEVDAIVNATNTELVMGGGVSGAIFRAAGATKLKEACDKLAPIKVGEAIITPGFELPAKYIIHTAGPIYHGGKQGEKTLLQSCYINSLKLALDKQCESIAFPLISSGVYGYPKADALRVATGVIRDFLNNYDLNVVLVVFDKDALIAGEELLGEIEAFIDENYVGEYHDLYGSRRLFHMETDKILLRDKDQIDISVSEPHKSLREISNYVYNMDEPFSSALLHLIDTRGMTDVEVYKRANIDRRLFSKIRNNKGYMPSKRTAIALAIALELDLDETDDLLRRAGYALSESQVFDVVIQYFIINQKYDIFEINEVLFHYDQPLLGG